MLAVAAVPTGWRPAAEARAGDGTHARHVMAGMSTQSMERAIRDWYAVHPARGAQATVAPSDSFLVGSFYFDNNGDGSATQVDTAKVFEGQVVLWKLVSGSHTVTSGTGSTDPAAGSLFDQPIGGLGNPTRFAFQFNTAGTYRFFCRPHETFNMRGVVVVKSAADVSPLPERAAAAGFLGAPAPNPFRGTSTFRFALAQAGRARAEVFDVRGRRVATVMDRDLAAGAYAAAWDGRDAGGQAAPGVYFIRLNVPGREDVRRVVVAR